MSMSGRSGSAPIFRASAVLSSSGRSLSNRAKEMSSAVRYQGCRLRKLVVAADTLGSYFLNLCRERGQYTLYSTHYTAGGERGAVYTIQYTLYSGGGKREGGQYTLYSTHYTAGGERGGGQYTLYSTHYTLYIGGGRGGQYTLYSTHYTEGEGGQGGSFDSICPPDKLIILVARRPKNQ